MTGATYIGTSGWSYDHWQDVLYPPDLPARDRLARYVERFGTVELNASFYRWPRERTFAGWRRRLPDGFRMSVKAPRGLTHAKQLYAPEVWVERIARCWHELRDRRGVLLVQLPPAMTRDDARLDYFLGCLPTWLDVAVELRHDSWHCEPVFDLLARHHAAYVVLSGARLPCVLRATAQTVYVRLHGPDHDHLYGGLLQRRRPVAGGRIGSGSGAEAAMTSTPTSTTTATDTPCAMRRPYARSWPAETGLTVRPCAARELSASATGSGDHGVRARGSRWKAGP